MASASAAVAVGRIGVGADLVEVAADHGSGVGRERVERHRQVEHRRGVEAVGAGDPPAVATVGSGARAHRAILARARARRPETASRVAARASVTSRLSATARPMSSAVGGRPSPSGGRTSTRSP